VSSITIVNVTLKFGASISRIVIYDRNMFVIQGTGAFPMGLNHPLDGVTNLKYKLLHLLTTKNFLQRDEGTSF
jgi:hypothetical protein